MNDINNALNDSASVGTSSSSVSPKVILFLKKLMPYIYVFSLIFSVLTIIVDAFSIKTRFLGTLLSSSIFNGGDSSGKVFGYILLYSILSLIFIGSLNLFFKREFLMALLALGWMALSFKLVIFHFFWLPRLPIDLSISIHLFKNAFAVAINPITLAFTFLIFASAQLKIGFDDIPHSGKTS